MKARLILLRALRRVTFWLVVGIGVGLAAHIDERWSILKSMTDQVPEWQAELDEAIQDVREAGSGAIEVKARNDGTGNDEMNADQGADGAQDEEMDWDRGEWGATTIGAALWSHPKRYE